jgi:hypothetical protein
MFASGRYNGGSNSGKVVSAAKDTLMDNTIVGEGRLLAYATGGAQHMV